VGMVLRFRNGYTLGSILLFFLFINGIIERYPELYDEDGGGNSTQHQINFGRKWGNYSTIVELCGGDINKMDEVLTQPLEKTLLLLAFKSDRALMEKMINDEQMRRMNV
jgi:hypothetical protein